MMASRVASIADDGAMRDSASDDDTDTAGPGVAVSCGPFRRPLYAFVSMT